MSNTVTVQLSICDDIRYFFSQQPLFVDLIICYAIGCLLLWGSTRNKGFLISFFAGFLYLVPLFVQHPVWSW